MHEARIAILNDHAQSLAITDTLAEAGRKIALPLFIAMLQHEEGARSGENIEDVHQMRVATRRMRTLFKAFKDDYKQKSLRKIVPPLCRTARLLGAVRDIDVLWDDLQRYHSAAATDLQAGYAWMRKRIDKRRNKARKALLRWLDSEDYAAWLDAFTGFLIKAGKGAVKVNEDDITPYQVRHVLPVLLHQRLAAVRAFDVVIDEANTTSLHNLRIRFKQLRYMVEFFRDVLGSSAENFIEEIKAMQDLLGRLNDIAVAQAILSDMKRPDETVAAAVEQYTTAILTEQQELLAALPNAWARFNSRIVQRALSDALLVLR